MEIAICFRYASSERCVGNGLRCAHFARLPKRSAMMNGTRDKRLVAIVTPLYRFPLTPDEDISIRHLRSYLGQIDRYAIGPAKPPSDYSDFQWKQFPSRYFEGPLTY